MSRHDTEALRLAHAMLDELPGTSPDDDSLPVSLALVQASALVAIGDQLAYLAWQLEQLRDVLRPREDDEEGDSDGD